MNNRGAKAYLFATELEARSAINAFGFKLLRERPFKVFENDKGNLLFISRVGILNAADCMWYAARDCGVSSVCNIGACGALKSGFEIGDFVRITRCIFNFKYSRKVYSPSLSCGGKLDSLKGASLITSVNPVVLKSERERLSGYADVVDMEFYAICKAAELNGIEVSAIKYVSDFSENCNIEKNIQKLECKLLEYGEIF